MWYGIFLDFTVSGQENDVSNEVEPIEPPKPKTEEVVLNKYLVGVGLMRTMLVATAEYMDTYYYDYKLIGPSETIEVEVGV
jgi:hypothetical protein